MQAQIICYTEFIENHYPEPVVGAFILNDKHKLFLMKSHKWSNLYVVPGGHIEWEETIEHALKREVKEETNLDVFNPTFICLWEFINEDEFIKKKHMIALNYLVHTKSKEVMLNDEAQKYIWVTREEALTLPLEKYTKKTIELFLGANFILPPKQEE